jgi:hypothetical protein
MDDPTSRNRLDGEASPYLSAHADNPVHWQPWDEAALEAARERDVPIFLSVGYSACHWCHVMAEESFEDPAVAETLNEAFVPVKVDREERPDVDSVYMTVASLVTGSGGWPLSVWLTPDLEPFYVGTYFPPTEQRGMPAFHDVLRGIADSWRDPEQRAEMESRADQWTRALVDRLEETPDEPGDPPGEDVLADAVTSALRSFDAEYGGFSTTGPKFPVPGRIELLLTDYARSGREEALRAATATLDAMADGGTYDHVGGGFHRYATDRQWRVPHFEKMLYDNAELPRVYLAAHQVTGDERYARVARETFAFLDRELSHPDGGFFATLDARSAGEEGRFYVWTRDEVRDAVGDEDLADLFCERYGVGSGNLDGSSVPYLARSVADLADERGADVAETRDLLAAARERVFEARAERERPARDEKVLAGWNGLAVSALAAGARVLDADAGAADDDASGDAGAGRTADAHAERARTALEFVRERLWDADGRRLARRFKDGEVKGDGYLEDYAFLARGALDLHAVTGEVEPLAFALDLARVIREEFYDADAGTLYFTPASGERLVARPQELSDQSTPSSLGVAVRLLARLDAFAPEEGFGDVVERVLATHADRIRASPVEHVSLSLAAAEHATGTPELTVAAEAVPAEWRATLADRYLPGAVVTRRPSTEAGLRGVLDALGLDEAPPIWANREARGGPTVYACEGFTCSPPQSSMAAAVDWFAAGGEDAAADLGAVPSPAEVAAGAGEADGEGADGAPTEDADGDGAVDDDADRGR